MLDGPQLNHITRFAESHCRWHSPLEPGRFIPPRRRPFPHQSLITTRYRGPCSGQHIDATISQMGKLSVAKTASAFMFHVDRPYRVYDVSLSV
jgi:hypothetical protein